MRLTHFAGVVLVLGGVLVGCRQAAKPPSVLDTQVEASAPAEAPTAQPAEAPQTQPAAEPVQTQARRLAAGKPVEVRTLGIEPDQPLAILSKSDPKDPARLLAVLESDDRMTIRTDNVDVLRLDLLALPRERLGRLVVQIDGQGIEITGKTAKVVYLRRSRVGDWSFARTDEIPATPIP